MKLSEIVTLFPVELKRDAEFTSLGLITSQSSKQLVYIEDVKYIPDLLNNRGISCVLTKKGIELPSDFEIGIGIVENPKNTFYDIHNYLAKKTNFYGHRFKTEISKSANVHPTAFIAENNVRIGERAEIGPHVTILENTIIMDDVFIRAGTVIGSEGFGFNRFGNRIVPIVHAGGVLIHDRVEIQANCCIDKAMFGGYTEIDEDTKLDNLVYIAHNVKIGKRCLVAANVSITGSVFVGDDVWLGPSSAIVHEVRIGNGASISIGSIVTRNVDEGQRVTGNFAIDHNRFLDFIRTIRNGKDGE